MHLNFLKISLAFPRVHWTNAELPASQTGQQNVRCFCSAECLFPGLPFLSHTENSKYTWGTKHRLVLQKNSFQTRKWHW